MKYRKTLMLVLMFGVLLSISCRKTTEVSSSYAYTPQESVCLSADPDGSVVLRVWGSGANKADAIEHAKKKALQEVLFSGINKGLKTIDPLLYEVNAEEKYSYYFSVFFQDGGEYLNYITTDKSKRDSDVKAISDFQDKYGVVVTVYRDALRQDLIKNGILKP